MVRHFIHISDSREAPVYISYSDFSHGLPLKAAQSCGDVLVSEMCQKYNYILSMEPMLHAFCALILKSLECFEDQ